MESNKEIEAVAIHVEESADDSSSEEELEEEEEEEGDAIEIEVLEAAEGEEESLVETISKEVAAGRKLWKRISREKDDTNITIPKVPELLRKCNEDAYEPSVVSIGPYHMHNPRLHPMQMHKWRFLEKILKRNRNVPLNDYILEITSLEKQASRCYTQGFYCSQSEFVKMLLLDGCFLVELFLLTKEKKNDQIFYVSWNESHLTYDLILLENQIPFFILQRIYELVTPTTKDPTSFTRIAIDFCNQAISHYDKDMPPPDAAKIKHLLHLYHMHTLWSPESNSRELKSKCWSLLSSCISSFNVCEYLKKQCSSTPMQGEKIVNMMPSATELNEAGVNLKAADPSQKSIIDVGFSSDGVMQIPHLIIDDNDHILFRNLIAFEQLDPHLKHRFTAYVKFLNYFVSRPKDAELLYNYRIIDYASGNEEKIVRLFDSLARETNPHGKNYLHEMYAKVDKYCRDRRSRWRATRYRWWKILVHDYFSSPWSAISLAAAVILLSLTFLQTYYSMYSYYHPSP